MRKVNIGQAKEITETVASHVFNKGDGNNPAIMLHSKPGIGKSALVKQLCEDHGADFIDVRLSAMDAADVQGIPFVDGGEMKFSTPTWFPDNDGKPTVVFFDEINNAPQSVQHAAYRLILDRQVQNGRRFHDKVMVIAAGNRKEDKTGAKAMVPALANRFAVHLEVTEDKDTFVEYALGKGMNHKLVGFLEWQPQYLHVMPKAGQTEFPSPRSWEMVANHLAIFGDTPQNNYALTAAVEGAVGESASHSFMAYLKYFGKLPDFTKIMDGKEEYSVPQDDIGIQFAVTTSLVQHAAANIDNETRCENLIKVYDQLPDENKILFVKQLKNVLGSNRSAIIRSPFKKLKELKKYLK